MSYSIKDREYKKFVDGNTEEPKVRTLIANTDPIPVDTGATGTSSLLVTNKTIATPSTEVSHALQTNVKQLIIRSRAAADLQIAFISGQSGTTYITLRKGAVFSLDGVNLASSTVYMQASIATTVEILEIY